MNLSFQARQLRLSPPPSSAVSSILSDPSSQSLAVSLSDSGITLYPNLSPFSPPFPSATTTAAVPPPSSAAAFLRLRSIGTSRVMFVVSSPHLAGSSVLLRFYMLRSDKQFARVRVICNQSDLSFDEKKVGVVFRVNHGDSVMISAGVNVFAMYSDSERKVWVLAVKVVEQGEVVKVMRTAVIDCELPVFCVSVSLGFLMLGEENGVRVFALRPLVKGRVKKLERLKARKVDVVNGMGAVLYVKSGKGSGGSNCVNVNGNLDEKIGKHCDKSAKLRPMKMRQTSQEGGTRFVPFKSHEFEVSESSKEPLMIKAISIHFLARNKFLILDSVGELYLLSVSSNISGSESVYEMKQLTLTMNVQNLAVYADDSTKAQIVWISDGQYTIHAIIVSDADSTANENDINDIEEKIQSPATQVIFTSEKIQEIIPLSANAILLLGQANNIFAYAIS